MSAEAGPSQPLQQAGKKRKRTGKEREERKQAAILAAQAKADEERPESTEARIEDSVQAVEAPGVDFATLEARLPRALTHLRHVFKRAKTVEMTRLIKKIKNLRSKGGAQAELEDLEAQRQIMAHISLNSTLSAHLLANIRKHRSLKRTPNVIPPSIVGQLSSSASASASSSASDAVVRKVENRLCSSKVVAQDMKSAVAWVMNEQGAKLGAGVKAEGPKVQAAKGGQSKAAAAKTGPAVANGDDDEDDDDEVDGDVSFLRQVAVDSGDEDEEGDQEADAAGWESGSVSGADEPPSTLNRSLALSPPDSEDEDEDDQAVSLSPRPAAKKTKPTANANANAKDTAPSRASKQLTSSTFLPSLSTGFTRGGSEDSDPDDDFGEGLEDVIGKGSAGVRKNRRGQRARQLIWERKYGKNAKHIQKAKEKETEGNIANAYGKRAGPAKTSTPHSAGSARPATATSTRRPASESSTVVDRSKTDPSPAVHKPSSGLHPSWEAARLRKQKEATGPKATKIVFD